jgi:hypothetical protein
MQARLKNERRRRRRRRKVEITYPCNKSNRGRGEVDKGERSERNMCTE